IEPVWHELKAGVRALPHRPSTVQELVTAVKQVWEKIETKDVDKYIDRMDEVIEAVLRAKGGHTRF
ncbi:hypothetical protein K435DRAFT_664582, partial [Dendrothele bispora CBS 962.96]